MYFKLGNKYVIVTFYKVSSKKLTKYSWYKPLQYHLIQEKTLIMFILSIFHYT